MMNEESRKYFNRAYLSSGTAFTYFALSTPNHLTRMKEFTKITDENELIDFLKVADTEVLAKCNTMDSIGKMVRPYWSPTIELPQTVGAFMTKTPHEIYNSQLAPNIDTMFSFNSMVSEPYY